MAIKRIQKTVTTRKYTCDILFKDIVESEVVFTCGRYETAKTWCASQEAISRLPAIVTNNDELLKLVICGCGEKINGFLPEMLFDGFWIATSDPFLLTNSATNLQNYSQLDKAFLFNNDFDKFKTWNEAYEYAAKDLLRRNIAENFFYIFSIKENTAKKYKLQRTTQVVEVLN